MARARKVDREQARELALKAFWLNGYSNLGVRKLEEATGINRFMLQTEFGGKGGLFAEVLDNYLTLSNETTFDGVRDGNLDALVELFLNRASDNLPAESNNGCLMINTLCENDIGDDSIKERVASFMQQMQSAIAQAIKNEEAQGTLLKTLDVVQASEMLMASLVGINVLVKLNGNNKAALPSAQLMAETILSWRTREAN